MRLAHMLRLNREQKGYTLREVQKRTGVSYARLSEIENERGNNPTIDTLERLRKLYGIHPEAIYLAAVRTLRKAKRARPLPDPQPDGQEG